MGRKIIENGFLVHMVCWSLFHRDCARLKSGYANETVLSPEDLKAVLGISNYDKEKMRVIVTNIGNLGVKEFYHISCKICKSKFVPQVLHLYRSKLP